MGTKFSVKYELLMQFLFAIVLLISLWGERKYNNSNLFLYLWPIIIVIQFIFHNKFVDIDDEFTKNILGKVDNICMDIIMTFLFIVGATIVSSIDILNIILTDKYQIGLKLLFFYVFITILRLGLFIYYDRNGIVN